MPLKTFNSKMRESIKQQNVALMLYVPCIGQNY